MTTVVLNGTSSAGKTSLAHALPAVWDGPLQVSGIDTFLACQDPRMFRGDRGFRWESTTVEGLPGEVLVPGEDGEAVLRAAHRFWAAAHREGVDQVVDHVLLSQQMADDLRAQLGRDGVRYAGCAARRTSSTVASAHAATAGPGGAGGSGACTPSHPTTSRSTPRC